jgi:DNA helicase II / ATP-dependent DNA helicase PcrA
MTWDSGLTGIALQIAGTNENPLRVMAGPGTGKTFAMKRRVARLLEEGIVPTRILAVTFTRTAAANLVNELRALGVAGCDEIRAGTLHSFCFSLLQRADVFSYLGRVARPLVTFNKSGVMRFEGAPLLADLNNESVFGSKREGTKRIRAFEAAWARLQSDTPGWPTDPTDNSFHRELLDWLSFHEAMLIGELVPETLRFLRNNPASPELTAFDHVVVDEYQDLNRAEQVLVDLVAERCNNSIVGDVDQSIYGFRHAHPDGIVEFSLSHPTTHDESLVECRRCGTRIVAIADALIRNNHPPTSSSRLNPMAGMGPGEIHIVQWNNLDAEVRGIAAFVNHLITVRGLNPAEILVLCPRRVIGYQIREQLRALAVPAHSFYHEESLEAEQAQLAFTLLRLFANAEDRVALRFWLGFGSPSWNRGEYARVRASCLTSGQSPRETLLAVQSGVLKIPNINRLLRRFEELQNRLTLLARLSGLDLVNALFPDGEDWASSLREAALIAIEPTTDAQQLLDSLLVGITQPQMPEEGDFVRIMSLHKSKGLTSRAVVVVGCIHGLIPFYDRDETPLEKQETLAEQRRLFYVCITRPQEILVLSSVTSLNRSLAHQLGATVRWGWSADGQTVASQFLNELGTEAPNAQRGDEWQSRDFAASA